MTNKKFIEQAIGAMVTMWFDNFNISMDLLESTTFEVLEKIKPILENDLMNEESPIKDPMSFGMGQAIKNKDFLLDGTPVTTEKIAQEAIKIAKTGMIAQACFTVLEDQFDITDFLER